MSFELSEGSESHGKFGTQQQAEARAEQIAGDRGHWIKWSRVFNNSAQGICTNESGQQTSILTVRHIADEAMSE